MAVAYDLNDDTSPFGPVHFRDKQDVGKRLADAALGSIYANIGMSDKTAGMYPPWGPTVKEIVTEISPPTQTQTRTFITARITYIGVGDEGLVNSEVLNIFELAPDVDSTDDNEVIPASSITLEGKDTAVVEFLLPANKKLAAEGATRVLRYAYRNRPCPPRTAETPYVGTWCGLYSSPEALPALPFVQAV